MGGIAAGITGFIFAYIATFALIGVLGAAVAGAIGIGAILVALLIGLFQSLRYRNWGGLLTLVAVVPSIALSTYVSQQQAANGGFYYVRFMLAHLNYEDYDGWVAVLLGLLLLLSAVFLAFGWLMPIAILIESLEASKGNRPGVVKSTIYVLGGLLTGLLWGYVAGGSWAAMAAGVPFS